MNDSGFHVPGPDLAWSNSLAREADRLGPRSLGTAFPEDPVTEAFPDPHWIAVSDSAAAAAGLPEGWHERADWQAAQVFSGQRRWAGMRPMATVYSGHQFGVWAGQLGDGRAVLLGELAVPPGPHTGAGGPLEVQLKGSGRTPYSRRGDGRAVLRSSVREFLCSEAMHHLGVPTTRALGLLGSPLPVMREGLETAAIVVRTAPSFLRFGHLEHFGHLGHHERLEALVEFVLRHHDPEHWARVPDLPGGSAEALLQGVVERTARLMAQWQALGFCHGVMNTDNLSLLGLTIDYGPFGFLDAFDPGHVCNHSDTQGRYAFARQPNVAWWNLHALGHALRPLVARQRPGADADELLPPVLEHFADAFSQAFNERLNAKFGFSPAAGGRAAADDGALINEFLGLLAQDRVDHTIAFRRLSQVPARGPVPDAVRDLFIRREAFDAWVPRYQARLQSEPADDAVRQAAMNAANPKFVLRNHLAQQAIDAATAGDFSEVRRLHQVLQHPYDEAPAGARPADADFPPSWAQQLEVSCSS